MRVQKGELEMVRLLVKYGADQHIKSSGLMNSISSREMAEYKEGMGEKPAEGHRQGSIQQEDGTCIFPIESVPTC